MTALAKKEENTEIMEMISKFDQLPVVQCRSLFDKLENSLLEMPQLSDSDYQLKEYVSGGLYCRQITIPAGALITGRIYKFDHIETMISGNIIIVSADGGTKEYHGHNVIQARSGKRQAGLALKDTVWVTTSSVPEHMKIKDMLDYTSVLTYQEYNEFYKEVNTLDYQSFLAEIGVNQEQMNEIVNSDPNKLKSKEYENIYKSKSNLCDDGLFSKTNIKQGEIVYPCKIDGKRSFAGRFTNHALYPNTCIKIINNEFYFVANRDIDENQEITTNYREVMNIKLQNNGFNLVSGEI